MNQLKNIDEVAYVRFASVYRQFTDVNTFIKEIEKLIDVYKRQEEYEEQIQLYAEEYVKQEMVIYLFAQVEGVEVTDEEYDQFLQDNLEAAGFESEDDFKDYTGMSLEEYAETARLERNMLLTKELDMLYDRLLDNNNSSDDTSSDDAATE